MAVKRIIKYKDKNYELSTVYLENMCEFETMIFPMKNEVISGSEVYCFRTTDVCESYDKHIDIIRNVGKYVSEEAINEYLKSKEDEEDTHGKWVLESDEEMADPMFKLLVCSVCGGKVGDLYNYCPHCGIKMSKTIKT